MVILPKTPLKERVSLPCEYLQEQGQEGTGLLPALQLGIPGEGKNPKVYTWALRVGWFRSSWPLPHSTEEFLRVCRHPGHTQLAAGVGECSAVC